MFFDHLSDLPTIAAKTSCSIFVVPPDTEPDLKHPLYLRPDESKTTTVITVEQIRVFLALTSSRETSERFFVITPADAMNEAAQNAFLKTFEEPKDHCHFVLLTESPSSLLPTILSRAQVFYLRKSDLIDSAPSAPGKTPAAREKNLALAKKLISTPARDLPALATELTKSKTAPRQQVLDLTATAIDLLYKSYFKTGNAKFLAKLHKLITLYDNLSKNGHIKLHIVADLC